MIDAALFKAAREEAKLSQSTLAKEAGTSQTTVDKIERGETKSSRMLPKLAKRLGREPAYFDEDYANDNPTTPAPAAAIVAPDAEPNGHYRPEPEFFDRRRTMPVYASAEGGDGHLIVSYDELDRVDRPHTLQRIEKAYAILITGDSMFPAFEPGDRAWVNPLLPPMRETNVILYRVDDGMGEAKASIKRLVGWTETDWIVQQWNPARKFKLSRKEWFRAERVVGKFDRA